MSYEPRIIIRAGRPLRQRRFHAVRSLIEEAQRAGIIGPYPIAHFGRATIGLAALGGLVTIIAAAL